MSPRLRKIMAGIAAGIPLAIPILTAPLNIGGCYPLGYQCPETIERVVIQHANDGTISEVDCHAACGSEQATCGVIDAEQIECMTMEVRCPPAGRPPAGALAGFAARRARSTPSTRWLASAAVMEAASIIAFDELARDLDAHRLPTRLVDDALVASADEASHTRHMTLALGARIGATRIRVGVERSPIRTFEALAIGNVVDGCAGEAWAAIEAAAQAELAVAGDIRSRMRTIAADEAQHALLSFTIGDAIGRRAGSEAVRQLEHAHERAMAELYAGLASQEPDAELGRLGGVDARALFVSVT
ncbi:MAG: hypothetical protein AB7S26_41630 [Sandaracinaceae bacterium]